MRGSWIGIPFVSVLLLVGSSYPLYWWPLGFIALVPLFVLLESAAPRRAALAGFLVGFLYPLALMHATVMEFTWLPDAHFFQTIIRFASVPVALVIGAVYAGALYLYAKRLRGSSVGRNALVFALLWALVEWLVTVGTGGFNLGILADAAAGIPFFTSLAAVGGIHFVSFLVLLVNGLVGAGFLAARRSRADARRLVRFALAAAVAVAALFFINTYYLRHGQVDKTLAVAVLQNNDRAAGAFGAFQKGSFSFPALANLIQEAQAIRPDVVIYPFAVAKELLDTGAPSKAVATGPLAAFAAWEKRAAGKQLFVSWNTIDRNGAFSNEIDFWREGQIVSSYQKKTLMPFIDYTPVWAEHAGFYSTVVDETPGPSRQSVFSDGSARIGSAVCSEINSAATIQSDTAGANIGFSIGSDAMFSSSFAAESDLVSAQFRAAENNVAFVRANRFGPSGFIASDGALLRATPSDVSGAFVAHVPYELHPRRTLYSVTGDGLFVLGSIAVLILI